MELGARVGPYRLSAVLGAGATGAVYRAEDTRGGPDVALKVLEPGQADPDFVSRFRRGARATAGLEHPNVARVLDFGEDGGRVFLATELLEGRDLFEVLRAEGPLSEARATRVLVEITRALEAAHGAGVVHRDLKPENVFLSGPDGAQIKVVDFGIAKWVERDADPAENAITKLGTLVGTPDYMSPEQCLGEPVDARSDVYACGVLLFELLTKRTPLSRATPTLTAAAHAAEPPPRLADARPGVDARLDAIVATCLAKRPSERYASAAELRAALEAVSAAPRWQGKTTGSHERVTLERVTIAPTSEPRTRAPESLARRSRLPWIALAVAVLVAVVIAIVWR